LSFGLFFFGGRWGASPHDHIDLFPPNNIDLSPDIIDLSPRPPLHLERGSAGVGREVGYGRALTVREVYYIEQNNLESKVVLFCITLDCFG
jgi:hypothetical protein